ncbi:hypothetical protein [Paenibacillus agricola]|uniref:Uncharacterized protein n=1 Tax=Paenibacillus agricola TaxID=2716264 RepID=A0ABX0J8K7_9BACL|nr:hypothetical protein [Paenibacillus agricola]NHN31168.1 hypothetical protein [Paenibacillus agricola]
MSRSFIAINRNTNAILTSGAGVYSYESSARRGIGQNVSSQDRADYVIIELTAADIAKLLAEKGIGE